ncbi:MAG: SgcJ/EcaC family oxidoreductase [Rubricoccaceae bacterium]|nr:SgcJ/EcaC family oxidoreductase [Rubricoccaceae bacterium]
MRTVALFLVLGSWLCPAAAAQEDWTPEQLDVLAAVHAYLDAWNRSDAHALAALCRADCDRIDARGNVYRGKDAIFEHYARVFASPPPPGVTRSLAYDVFSVRIVAPDVAIVDARYTLRSPPPRPDATIEGMNTVVLVRTDGRWLRVAHRQRVPTSVASAPTRN